MKDLIVSLIVSGICIFIGGEVLPNVEVSGIQTALIAAGGLALANTFIRPILRAISAPVRWITLGLFSFVINAVILMLVAYFVDGFSFSGEFFGFVWALALSFVISVLSTVFGTFVN